MRKRCYICDKPIKRPYILFASRLCNQYYHYNCYFENVTEEIEEDDERTKQIMGMDDQIARDLGLHKEGEE